MPAAEVASAQQWPACANRQYNVTAAGKPELHTVGPVSNTSGTLSAPETIRGGTFCQHALTVTNSVVTDVTACSHNQSDAAVNIAHQIAAKVSTT
jgi:serine/threonine kinase PknH